MHAFLVAVPGSVLCHGADQQIHAVRRFHEGRVIADAHVMHVSGHLFAVRDLADRRVDGLYVLLYAFAGKEGYYLAHVIGGAVQDALDILFTDLSPVIQVRLLYELRQNDSPDEIYRHDIGAVDDGDAWIERVFLCFWRDQVNADGARSIGIKCRVQDFTESGVHIRLKIVNSPCLA